MPKTAAVANKRRAGRPLKGETLVREYPVLSVRIDPLIKVRLNAVSTLVNKPIATVVADALEHYFQDLPDADQKALEVLTKRLIETKRVVS